MCQFSARNLSWVCIHVPDTLDCVLHAYEVKCGLLHVSSLCANFETVGASLGPVVSEFCVWYKLPWMLMCDPLHQVRQIDPPWRAKSSCELLSSTGHSVSRKPTYLSSIELPGSLESILAIRIPPGLPTRWLRLTSRRVPGMKTRNGNTCILRHDCEVWLYLKHTFVLHEIPAYSWRSKSKYTLWILCKWFSLLTVCFGLVCLVVCWWTCLYGHSAVWRKLEIVTLRRLKFCYKTSWNSAYHIKGNHSTQIYSAGLLISVLSVDGVRWCGPDVL